MLNKGAIVKIKKEWLAEGERDIPYFVVEDREHSVLIQPLPQYCHNQMIIPIEEVRPCMIYLVDDMKRYLQTK